MLDKVRTGWVLLAASAALLATALAQDGTGDVPAAATDATPAFREVGPGRWEMDRIQINKAEGAVTFPAVVNMTTGMVEYAIVTTKGKVHESILRTDINPARLHMAMLLLGVESATGADPAKFYEPGAKIPGGLVTVEVSWQQNGNTVRKTPTELLTNPNNKRLSITNWVYNGSQIVDGIFTAERDGSIVSLIADPYAMINNPREDRQNDELWTADPNQLPSTNAPVEVTIRLVKKQGTNRN